MNMNRTLITAALAVALAPAMAEPLPRAPLNELAPQAEALGHSAMFTSSAAGHQMLRVKVFDPSDRVVLDVETSDQWVEFVPRAGMPDGIYRYQTTSIGDVDPDTGAVRLVRDSGYFHVSEGRVKNVDEPEELGLLDNLIEGSAALAGRVLDWAIPAAHAQDAWAYSTAPSIFFDDTQDEDCTAGYDWFMKADGGVNDADTNNTFTLYGYGEYPAGQGCNPSVATILKIFHDGNTSVGSAAKSIYIEADGDLSLANNSMFFDRSHGRLKLEGETAGGQSELQLTDSASNNSARFKFDGTTASLTNNSGGGVINWHRSAPANSISIDSAGNVSFLNGVPGGGGGGAQPLEGAEVHLLNGSSAYVANNGSWFLVEGNNGRQDIIKTSLSAPVNSAVIASDGDVGLGTGSPQAPLHVRKSSTAQVFVENTTGSADARTLFKLKNRGNTKFEIEESQSGESWAFTNSGADFRVSRQGSGQIRVTAGEIDHVLVTVTLTRGGRDRGKQVVRDLEVVVRTQLHAIVIAEQDIDVAGAFALGDCADQTHNTAD